MALFISKLPRPAKTLIVLTLGLIVSLFSYTVLDISSLSQYAQYADPKAVKLQQVPLQATFATSSVHEHPLPNSLDAHQFWHGFAKLLRDGDPVPVVVEINSTEDAGWPVFAGISKDAKQPETLNLTKETVDGLRSLHANVVEDINQIAGRLPFIPGTRGIVTTAGSIAEAILATSLRMLRKSGSRLPVQVWMYDEKEYDPYMCEEVYRPMDVHCMLITDHIPEDILSTGSVPLTISHHFQMKILSMMFSTFEQALFLDCDLFPINNPDSIFLTEPFLSSGWVLWPDYWANTNSKYYGQIVERPQFDQYSMQSTESGAMLVNKVTHASAMLLAAYYNRYGPSHWYWLFSQGAIGHGDKDTYVPAINYYNLPFYQVDNPPRRIGYRCNGEERAIASGQSHPYDDYLLTSHDLSRAHDNLLSDIPEPRILFVHGNLPKNDPVTLMDWRIPESWEDQLRCDRGKGQAHRQWGSKRNTVLLYGYDAEKTLWDQMRWLACTHEFGIKRWVDGFPVECNEEAVRGHWCPPDKLGQTHMFHQPQRDICTRFTSLYNEILPDESYDASLPSAGAPELPWSSIAGATTV